MKFTANKTSLLAELARLQGIVEKKSTIPTLATILFETADNTDIRMVATDLDVSFGTTCPAEIHEPGAICIPGKRLYEIVRSLPDAEIEIRTEEDAIHIKCQKSKFKLMGLGREHFPEVKTPEGKGVRINGTLWAEAVRRIYPCVTQEESRYSLNGVLGEIGGGKLILVATDGHRLGYIEAKGEYSGEVQKILIPKKAVSESEKLAQDGDFQLHIEAGHLHFVSGKRTLTTRQLSGQFPNYQMVLPTDHSCKATVNASVLASAIRRCSLVADERSRAIKLEFLPGQISIMAQSAEAGEGQDSVEAQYEGPATKAGFNAQYMLDHLAATENGEVEFSFKNGNTQFEMQVKAETRWLGRYITMPMRLD